MGMYVFECSTRVGAFLGGVRVRGSTGSSPAVPFLRLPTSAAP